jgi:hypothetical protein
MAESSDFVRMFSGDISQVPEPMRKVGWASGYAASAHRHHLLKRFHLLHPVIF